MGRKSAARPAPPRPAAAWSRSASSASVPARTVRPPPSVPARTAPPPPPATKAQAEVPATQQKSPGLFGQMASTAAGVAVGSTVGNMVGAGISGMFGGGSAAATPVEETTYPVETANPVEAKSSAWETPSCDADVKAFRKCLDDNQGNMQICGWYLDQLTACMNMAKEY